MTTGMTQDPNYSVIPNSCPHQHYSRCGLPPFVPWPEPCCDGCCPVNLGPWGAWRAVVAQIHRVPPITVHYPNPRLLNEIRIVGGSAAYCTFRHNRAMLRAAGWSP